MAGRKIDIYQKAAIWIALFAGILICWSFIKFPDNMKNFKRQESVAVLPDQVRKLDDKTREYRFDFDAVEEGMCLYFISDLQKVWIYQDEKLIYSTNDDIMSTGKTSGKLFHFVDIPSGQSTITVTIQTTDKNMADGPAEFLLGDCKSIFRDRVVEYLPYAVVYFMILLGGAALFFYWLIVRRYLEDDKTGLYFALLLTVTGLWFLRGSDFINVLFLNDAALYFSGYILFLQIPFLLFEFSLHYLQIPCKRWIKNMVCTVSFLNMLICTILHISGIREFRETAFLTHILLVSGFGFMFYGVYQYWKKYRWNYKTLLTLCPLIVILISVSIDLLNFYGGTMSSYRRGGVVILGFMLFTSIGVLYDLVLQLREGQKNAIYKKIAITDLLTGLYNRNAYEAWVDEHRENFSDISVILCDLNNLKYYNDNYGHELGDKYIISAAEILSEAIGRLGKCYRIGGDEFIAVLENTASDTIKECFNKMEFMQQQYNKNNHSLVIEMACGYAVAEKNDSSVADIVKRADNMMYKHKVTIKEKRAKKELLD